MVIQWGTLMGKVFNLLKESIWDYTKDNVKQVIVYIIAVITAVVPNFIKQVNSIELAIKLPIIILFILLLFLIAYNRYTISKKYNALKKENDELLNPDNENVKNFQPGDIVILRLEKDLTFPRKSIVSRILKSEIICRSEDGKLVHYAPEELLTKEETSQVTNRIEYERQKTEKENRDFWNSMYS